MRARIAILAGLLAVLAPAASATALSPGALQIKLAREMRLAGAASGAYVVDLASGRPLFALRANVVRSPASVEKLYTTSAALLALGPTATLNTTVLGATGLSDGVIAGDVWLQGGGDPTLTTTEIRALADQLVDTQGVQRISGSVIGDESRFDGLRGSFDSGFALDSEVEGQLGALMADRGYVRHGFQKTPALYAAQRFAAQLRLDGVTVTGKTGTGHAPAGAAELERLASPPVSALIGLTNAPSDNFLAEMLLKALGVNGSAAGSTAAGAAAVRAQLASFGVHPHIVDGSGLSRADLTTPREVVRLLQRMAAQATGQTFLDSLAVAGRTGTLATRMRGTPAAGNCQAKTGSLRFISNLAGICTTPTGERVAFAILMNAVNVHAARRIQDRMTAAIASLSPAAAAPAVPPRR